MNTGQGTMDRLSLPRLKDDRRRKVFKPKVLIRPLPESMIFYEPRMNTDETRMD